MWHSEALQCVCKTWLYWWHYIFLTEVSGAFRTSPSSSLYVYLQMNRPLLFIRKKILKFLSSFTTQNPEHSGVFSSKFKTCFDRRPNQIPPLGNVRGKMPEPRQSPTSKNRSGAKLSRASVLQCDYEIMRTDTAARSGDRPRPYG